MSFPSIKEKILIDLQLSCCNYGCIFFFQAKHSTQSYFIIQKTDSFQRFLKSLVWGIFNVFFSLWFSPCVQGATVFICYVWGQGPLTQRPSWWGEQGRARVSFVGLYIFKKDLFSEWQRASSLGHQNQTHWAAGHHSLCLASCFCNLTSPSPLRRFCAPWLTPKS